MCASRLDAHVSPLVLLACPCGPYQCHLHAHPETRRVPGRNNTSNIHPAIVQPFVLIQSDAPRSMSNEHRTIGLQDYQLETARREDGELKDDEGGSR